MAKNFLPIVLTLGLAGVGLGAFYLATKKEGDATPLKIPSLEEIIAYFTGLFGGGGGGNGDGCVKKTCASTEEWNQAQCKCVKKGSGGDPCVKKTCSSGQEWNQSQCKCVTKSGGTAKGSVVFGAAGDWGSGRNSNWKKLVAVMKSQKIQTMLGLGDYSYTSVGAWQPVVNELEKAGIKSKGAEGNHDGSGYAKTFGQSSFLHTFNEGPACVIIINTENSVSPNVAFVEKTLKATKQPWKILIMHKPLYTNSSKHRAESGLANALKPIINKYGVQLVLMAHNHNYQRMVISGYSKTVFIISGAAGESLYSLKGSQSGTKYMNDNNYGFTKISINGNTLKGQFINTSNKVLDSWTQTLGANANLAYVYNAYTYPVYLPPVPEEPMGMRISA